MVTRAEIERTRRVFEATSQGAYIRQTRDAAKMTLRELARRLDVSAPFLSDVEHGRRMLGKQHWLALMKALPAIKTAEMLVRTPPCSRCGCVCGGSTSPKSPRQAPHE